MSHADALLTILIPTRDRHETLVQVVDVLSSDLPDGVEILVSDNYSAPEARSVLPYRPNVRVIRTDRRMSMPDHWRFALGQVTSRYVTVMGDDDFIYKTRLRQIIPLIERDEYDLIYWHRGAYFWSSYRDKNSAGCLMIYNDSLGKLLSCQELLDKYFARTGDTQHLPSVYNAIVSCKSAAKYFGSIINTIPDDCIAPDVASALRISSRFTSALYCNFPISISGISKNSTGMNPHLVDKFFNEFGDLTFKPEDFALYLTPTTFEGTVVKTLLHDYCCAIPHLGRDMSVYNLPTIFARLLAWCIRTDQMMVSNGITQALSNTIDLIDDSKPFRPPTIAPLEANVLPIPNGFIRARLTGIEQASEARQIDSFLESQSISELRLEN